MPALTVPAAIPAVTELDTPASSRASAKIVRAAGPSMGSSVAAAWARSSMGVPAA